MSKNEVEEFLEEFEKADLNKKLEMWYFALDQQMIWEEILDEMSTIAGKLILKKRRRKK